MGLTFGIRDLLASDLPMFTMGEPVYSEEPPHGATPLRGRKDLLHGGVSEGEPSTSQGTLDYATPLHRNGKVAMAWDAMTFMTMLAAYHAPRRFVSSETHNVFRARSNGMEPKVYPAYRAVDLYEALAREVLQMVGQVSQTCCVTFVLVFDKGEIVVQEKAVVQAARNSRRDLPPYTLAGLTDDESMAHNGGGHGLPPGIRIVDAGIDLDGGGPVPIVSARLMQTRALRPLWYAYLASKFAEDKRFQHVRLLLDWCATAVHEIRDGAVVIRPSLAVPVGEGEVAAMVWAVRFSQTHRVQVRSGDSDLIALGLLHFDRFKQFPLMVVIHRRRTSAKQPREETFLTLNTRAFAQRLTSSGWTPMGFVLGLVANGTDFLLRSTYLTRVRKVSVFQACRAAMAAAPPPPPAPKTPTTPSIGSARKPTSSLCSSRTRVSEDNNTHSHLRAWSLRVLGQEDVFNTLVRAIMTWHYERKGEPLWTSKASGTQPMLPTKTTIELARLRTKSTGIASPAAVQTAHHQFHTNLMYWGSLQNNLVAATRMSHALVMAGLGLLDAHVDIDTEVLEVEIGDKRKNADAFRASILDDTQACAAALRLDELSAGARSGAHVSSETRHGAHVLSFDFSRTASLVSDESDALHPWLEHRPFASTMSNRAKSCAIQKPTTVNPVQVATPIENIPASVDVPTPPRKVVVHKQPPIEKGRQKFARLTSSCSIPTAPRRFARVSVVDPGRAAKFKLGHFQ
jgi:hypothetical protein